MRAHAARSDKIGNEGPSLKNFIATIIPKNARPGFPVARQGAIAGPALTKIYQPLEDNHVK
jgi:hypothetical protein